MPKGIYQRTSVAPESRFWTKVDKNGPVPSHRPELGRCWVWISSKDKGYGQFYGGPGVGRIAAYRFLIAAPPDGLEWDHLCRNRACVRPSHLELVTHRENMIRGATFAAANLAKTHCPQGHPYDLLNTIHRRGGRFCRMCAQALSRKRNAVQPKRGHFQAQKTHCPAGHEYNAENTAFVGHGRRCRTCQRLKAREASRRKTAHSATRAVGDEVAMERDEALAVLVKGLRS